MPRTARKKSESGVYHIVLRGINKQVIFYDDEDRKVFLNRLKLVKESHPFFIYAFCLMDNHVHLVVRQLDTDIGKIMQKVLTSFIFWYNRKYERVGNLFQDRFKSEPIDDDSYLLCAVRYVHQNPIVAGIAKDFSDFEWSSFQNYVINRKTMVEVDFLLDMLGGVNNFLKLMEQKESNKFLEYENNFAITDEKFIEHVNSIKKRFMVNDLLDLNKTKLTMALSEIKAVPGASLRQISRIIGIPASTIRYLTTGLKPTPKKN